MTREQAADGWSEKQGYREGKGADQADEQNGNARDFNFAGPVGKARRKGVHGQRDNKKNWYKKGLYIQGNDLSFKKFNDFACKIFYSGLPLYNIRKAFECEGAHPPG